jgi:hypothetical protein
MHRDVQPTTPGGGGRFSRIRSSGRFSDQGAANRGIDFSHPYLQDSVEMYMNCQLRAVLVFRRNFLGVVGPRRANNSHGASICERSWRAKARVLTRFKSNRPDSFQK